MLTSGMVAGQSTGSVKIERVWIRNGNRESFTGISLDKISKEMSAFI